MAITAPTDTSCAPQLSPRVMNASENGACLSISCQGTISVMAAAMSKYSTVDTPRDVNSASGRSRAGFLACKVPLSS